jgi:hypothetical protein
MLVKEKGSLRIGRSDGSQPSGPSLLPNNPQALPPSLSQFEVATALVPADVLANLTPVWH